MDVNDEVGKSLTLTTLRPKPVLRLGLKEEMMNMNMNKNKNMNMNMNTEYSYDIEAAIENHLSAIAESISLLKIPDLGHLVAAQTDYTTAQCCGAFDEFDAIIGAYNSAYNQNSRA